jgi:hypothetical protein
MRTSRRHTIPLPIHAGIETIAAPAIMVAPFLLGLSPAATAIAVGLGVMLFGLSLEVISPSRTIPISAHAGFEYALAVVAIIAGLAVGLATDDLLATAFLVGVGAFQVALTASTRFSVPLGA